MEKIEKAGNIAKKGLDNSRVRNIVIKVTEALLPLIFWIGMIAIIIQSFIAGSAAGSWHWYRGIVPFLFVFLSESIGLIVSLYFIYLLKDMRDALFSINDKQKVEDEQ